ncbi:hypothetical protein [Streptomyces sp. NRRL S-920]|uniref:hypothetical protein n=1 Tax=Streptomyces sp. NRRL S-920 TaxID=1463921 RepID=UPI0004CBF284|nr:hypothetical protein [Streptomyces sp. NRRL S-920]
MSHETALLVRLAAGEPEAGFREIDSTAKLDAKTLFDLVKLSFGVVAGVGALPIALGRPGLPVGSRPRKSTETSSSTTRTAASRPSVRTKAVRAADGPEIPDEGRMAPDASPPGFSGGAPAP